MIFLFYKLSYFEAISWCLSVRIIGTEAGITNTGEFVQVTKAELNNGVINACFMMLFKDLIRLLACYNDGIINLLGTYRSLRVAFCFDILLVSIGHLTKVVILVLL